MAALNPRGARFVPPNQFTHWWQRVVLTPALKPYGMQAPHIRTFGSRVFWMYGIMGFTAIYFGKEILLDLPRLRARLNADRKAFYGFMDKYELPREFDPLDDAHMKKFLAKRAAIVADSLGLETQDEYNPMSPAYYKHSLPPKDPVENMAWVRKSRNWDDYMRWLRATHPNELAAIENGSYFYKTKAKKSK